LWDSNESFYAETHVRWSRLTTTSIPRLTIALASTSRPQLLDSRPFYRLFGVSETAERLPIVLGAMIMVATAYG